MLLDLLNHQMGKVFLPSPLIEILYHLGRVDKWDANPEMQPVAVQAEEEKERAVNNMLKGAGAGILLLLLL